LAETRGRRVRPSGAAAKLGCRHRRWTRRFRACRSISIASRPTRVALPPPEIPTLFTNVGNCRRSRPLSCVLYECFQRVRLACACTIPESGETREQSLKMSAWSTREWSSSPEWRIEGSRAALHDSSQRSRRAAASWLDLQRSSSWSRHRALSVGAQRMARSSSMPGLYPQWMARVRGAP